MKECKHCLEPSDTLLKGACITCWLDKEHFIDPKDWESTGCYRVSQLDEETIQKLQDTYAPFQTMVKKTNPLGVEEEVSVGPYSFAIYVCEWAIRLGGGVWVMPRQAFPGDAPVPPELRPDVAIPVGPAKRVILAPKKDWPLVLQQVADSFNVPLEQVKVEKRKNTFGSKKKPDKEVVKRIAKELSLSEKDVLAVAKALREFGRNLSDTNKPKDGQWWTKRTEKLVITVTCDHRNFESEEQLRAHADLWHNGALGRRKRSHVHRIHLYDQDRNWGKVHHDHEKMLEKGYITNDELIEHLLLDHEGYVQQYPGDPGPDTGEHTHKISPDMMENGVLVARLGDLAGITWRKGMMDSDSTVKMSDPWSGVPDYSIKIRRKKAKYTMAKGQMIEVPWDYDPSNPTKKVKGGHNHEWYFEPGTDRQKAYEKHLQYYHPEGEPPRDEFHLHNRKIKDPHANMAKRLSTHLDYMDRLANASVGWWSKEGLLKLHTLLRMNHAAFACLSVTLGRAPELKWVVDNFLSHLELLVQTVDSDAAIKPEVLRQTIIDGMILQTLGFDRTQLLIAAPRRRWKLRDENGNVVRNADGTPVITFEQQKGYPEEKYGIDDDAAQNGPLCWMDWVTYSVEQPNKEEILEWLKVASSQKGCEHLKDERNRERDAHGIVVMAQVAGESGRLRLDMNMIMQITGFSEMRTRRMINSWRASGAIKSKAGDHAPGKARKYTILPQFRGEVHPTPLWDLIYMYYPDLEREQD